MEYLLIVISVVSSVAGVSSIGGAGLTFQVTQPKIALSNVQPDEASCKTAAKAYNNHYSASTNTLAICLKNQVK